ncbi:MAG: energy transducer TonB, partial [Bacteroidota bacterium]|nr:energy transducer TonB [Bacteroidota bacterium]
MNHQEEKKNKRNGVIGTVIFHSALLILFLFVGLSYYDPPIEDGIAINFGYTPDGAGETTQAPEEVKPTPQEEVVEENTDIDEDVVTQEVDDAPAVSKEKPKTKPVEKPKEPEPDPEPQPTNELLNRLNKVKNAQGSGEGETQGGGDQGDPNGDPNSDNRTGGGG